MPITAPVATMPAVVAKKLLFMLSPLKVRKVDECATRLVNHVRPVRPEIRGEEKGESTARRRRNSSFPPSARTMRGPLPVAPGTAASKIQKNHVPTSLKKYVPSLSKPAPQSRSPQETLCCRTALRLFAGRTVLPRQRGGNIRCRKGSALRDTARITS